MTSPQFAAFKVMSFDVVGTLIDFEGGMLAYLRKSGAAPSDVSDDVILDAYRASREELMTRLGALAMHLRAQGGIHAPDRSPQPTATTKVQ